MPYSLIDSRHSNCMHSVPGPATRRTFRLLCVCEGRRSPLRCIFRCRVCDVFAAHAAFKPAYTAYSCPLALALPEPHVSVV
eukprot:3221904-Prymnesium_polylepis.1